MSQIGERYRKGGLSYWAALVEIAIEHGIDQACIPRQWSWVAEQFVYILLGQRGRRWPNRLLPADLDKLESLRIAGHAVVQRELNAPRKRGRPKGAIGRHSKSDTPEAQRQRQRRGNPFNDHLTDEEFDRRLKAWLAERFGGNKEIEGKIYPKERYEPGPSHETYANGTIEFCGPSIGWRQKN